MEKVADIQGAATVDWSPLGDVFIKRYVNYNLSWQVNLAENHVAMAPYGGPVAVMLKELHKGKTEKQSIDIYTLSGASISTIPWEGGRVVGLGWTSSENLVVIMRDGSMAIYNIHGQQEYSRIITREAKDQGVCECKFFHTLEGSAGFAVMSNKYQFFVTGDSDRKKDEIRFMKMVDLPSSVTSKPSCWAVLPQGNQTSIIVAVEDKLYLLDPFEPRLQMVVCKKEPPHFWAEVAVSPTGNAVALVDREGNMWGGSTDFQRCETEFDLQSTSKILQMQWGGKDFFVVVMEKLMFVKGTAKHWLKHSLHEPCVLLPEIDGVRMLTNSACEFMHRVSNASLSVLRIGSMDPGALLNDAYKEFEGDESHKADEYIRYIKDSLPEAVTQCIKAAGEEFLPKIQQSLLKSANFGKGFLGPDVPMEVVNEFVEICHQLRVLNNVRREEVGIPVTYRQYYRLSTGVLLDRLINRGLYQLALEVSMYLKLPPALGEVKVLKQWAMRKVLEKNLSDEVVGEMIINKLSRSPVGVSFAEIAREARAQNRIRLAAQLLDHEIHAKDQVPLLMEMKRSDVALDKAIESGDPQLVYRVLEDLRHKHYQSQTERYLQLFHHRPVAAALYKKLCKEVDPEQLLNLHRQESEYTEVGCIHFANSFKLRTREDAVERNRLLQSAKKEFHEGQLLFQLKVVEDHEKLLKQQSEIEHKYSFNIKGMSVFHSIIECYKKRHPKIAEQLRKDYKLADNQFWWAKLRGLAHIGDYDEIERFSKQKKSPIGYEPFVEVCLHYGNRKEAVKYVGKVSPENRFKFYMLMEEFAKAAEAAFQARNPEQLNEVQQRAPRIPEVMEMVRQYQMKLGNR